MEAARRMSDAATPSADIVDARALVSVPDSAPDLAIHVRFSEVTAEVGARGRERGRANVPADLRLVVEDPEARARVRGARG
jgi:hypothetical protein